MAVYTAVDDPTAYFKVQLYTGNGSTNAITFNDTDTNMQPDWVWLKNRNSSGHDHFLFDVVNGVQRFLSTNDTGALASADSSYLTAFNSDGFTLGSSDGMNENSINFFSWNWKAGTSFTNDSSATGIGSIDSAGSVSTTSGFSIIKWTGTGATGTIAHGLGVVPKIIIVKSLANTTVWMVQHASLGNAKEIYFNRSDAAGNSTAWNSTTPTSTVFSVTGGGGDGVNASGDYIAYCFADVQGFSKFSSYKGNGNADWTFVYTGFTPELLWIKRSNDAANWVLKTKSSPGYNVNNNYIYGNLANNEASGSAVDFLSNGFKWRIDGANQNSSGDTFIYAAFAKAPIVNSNGVPSNAI